MERKIIAILMGPFGFGVYFLLRRDYYAALGAFGTMLLGIPFLRWFLGLEPSPTLYLVTTGLIIGATAFGFGYWRWKEEKNKR